MQLLLDTYALIYALARPRDLKEPAHKEIGDPDNEVFFTPANIWEIEIKVALGKLERPSESLVETAKDSYEEVRITSEHAAEAGRLPMHHKDPFDRMIIAQAKEENLTVVTPDKTFPEYKVDLMDC